MASAMDFWWILIWIFQKYLSYWTRDIDKLSF
jgi:hypothetical protein